MIEVARMTEEDWAEISPYFYPTENWGQPNKMAHNLIMGIVALRKFVGRKIIIHCGFEERQTGGYHPYGMAVDFHIEGLSPVDQFLACCRFDVFNGIGFYTWWNSPGCHVDVRPKRLKLDFDARWASVEKGKYVKVTHALLKGID